MVSIRNRNGNFVLIRDLSIRNSLFRFGTLIGLHLIHLLLVLDSDY